MGKNPRVHRLYCCTVLEVVSCDTSERCPRPSSRYPPTRLLLTWSGPERNRLTAPLRRMANLDKQPRVSIRNAIRVSELGEWEYCRLAWNLSRVSTQRDRVGVLRAEIGIRQHEAHAEVVSTALHARRIRNCCLVGIVVASITLSLAWVIAL